MMNQNNIPDVSQSWATAEKMLDKHFRKKRFILWSITFIITGVLVGLMLMINHTDKSTEKNLTASLQKENVSVSSSSIQSVSPEKSIPNTTVASSSNTPLINSEKSIASQNKITNRKNSKQSENGNIYTSNVSSSVNQKNKSTGVLIPVVAENTENVSSGENSTANVNTSFNKNNHVDITYASPFYASLEVKSRPVSTSEVSWPKQTQKVCYATIGWEATVYAGAQYVQKNLSTSNDWNNYMQHRENEEDPIVTPSIGVSVSANKNSLSLSLGVEYTYYGEKTNYYPYSNQETIINNGGWHPIIVSYVDTDTAYFTGNQYFMHTTLQRVDSSYINDLDTIEQYKYDENIAANNGINKLYYLEFPVEVSYCINRGRTGFGISAGLSPALLVQQKGHYLRADGKGIESFDEMETFRKFMVNGRVSFDLYYRMGARTKLVLRPQLRANLNSVFEDSYGVKQKYYSTGVLFGVSYMLN